MRVLHSVSGVLGCPTAHVPALSWDPDQPCTPVRSKMTEENAPMVTRLPRRAQLSSARIIWKRSQSTLQSGPAVVNVNQEKWRFFQSKSWWVYIKIENQSISILILFSLDFTDHPAMRGRVSVVQLKTDEFPQLIQVSFTKYFRNYIKGQREDKNFTTLLTDNNPLTFYEM